MKTKLITLLLTFVCLIFANEEGYSQNLDSGLVAHFPFDGDVKDYSKTAINGTPYNLVSAKNRNNNADSAYAFNGTSSYIDAGSSNRSITSTVSFSAWIMTDSADDNYMVCKYDDDNDAGFIFSLYQRGLIVAGRNGAGKFTIAGPSPVKLDDNKWHHVAASIDGNTWKIYVDCVLSDTNVSTAARPSISSNMNMTIGRHNAPKVGEEKWFKGTMDDLRVYNRLLTNSELDILCGKKTNSIGQLELERYFNVYPNPASTEIQLRGLPSETRSIQVYSLDGKMIKEKHSNFESMNVGDLAKGIYMLRVMDKDNRVLVTRKLARS